MFGFFGLGIIGFLIFTAIAIAIIVLKGYCLWTAAKRDETGWFIAILIINTFGILELVYLYFIVKKWDKKAHATSTHHDATPSEKV